jgi:hypothetical protein
MYSYLVDILQFYYIITIIIIIIIIIIIGVLLLLCGTPSLCFVIDAQK